MSMIKAISQVGSLTLISRVLGFMRDVLMARYLGAAFVADCFFVAFKLPNFFRRLFAEGAFGAAFVPMFVEELGDGSQGHKARAKLFAEQALAILLPILVVFTLLMQAFMPWVMYLLAPGFVDDAEKYALAVEFTRSTFPYLMLISLVALFSGVTNGNGRFAAGAQAPILLNTVLIGSLLLFNNGELMTGQALTRAVSIAGAVQLIWMARAVARIDFSLRLRWPRLSPKVKELMVIMLPAVIGAGAIQINLVIDIILASFLPEGSLSYLFYADRLNQLPIGVIGVAVGTVLLPVIARSLAAGDLERAKYDQNRAVEFSMFLTVPAAVAMVVIPLPLITAMFERGAFEAQDSLATAQALMAYAMGLPAYILIKVLTPSFFSRKDTKTPVKIGIAAMFVNTILNLILMGPLLHVGLALATAISAWVNAIALYVVMRKRGHFSFDSRVMRRLPRIIAAAVLMGCGLWFVADQMMAFLYGSVMEKMAYIGLLVVGGVAVYALCALGLKAMSMSEIKAYMRRRA